MVSEVLPLRAIAFQFLFILMAIAIEAVVFERNLGLTRRTSIGYATAVNLFSTFVGWIVFFVAEPLLPETTRVQLISSVFFGLRGIPPAIIGIGFLMFLATYLIKYEGLTWMQTAESDKPAPKEREKNKFRGREAQRQEAIVDPTRAFAVLLANALSFSAITIVLAIRTFLENATLP